jgi:hypothetical protein
VTQQLALAHPDSLIGIHLTDVPYLNLVTFYGDTSELSEAERKYLEEGRK